MRTYLVNSRNGDADFLRGVERESDEFAARIRAGCLALADPEPLSMFDHVYTEEPRTLIEEREQHRAYLDSFERPR
jgi:pyruvate dehydrogenase E1 component alpha subunit